MDDIEKAVTSFVRSMQDAGHPCMVAVRRNDEMTSFGQNLTDTQHAFAMLAVALHSVRRRIAELDAPELLERLDKAIMALGLPSATVVSGKIGKAH